MGLKNVASLKSRHQLLQWYSLELKLYKTVTLNVERRCAIACVYFSEHFCILVAFFVIHVYFCYVRCYSCV